MYESKMQMGERYLLGREGLHLHVAVSRYLRKSLSSPRLAESGDDRYGGDL